MSIAEEARSARRAVAGVQSKRQLPARALALELLLHLLV
jgi:hypothetical protein